MAIQDFGRWHHIVEYFDPVSGEYKSQRCLGVATAEALAEIKRQNGQDKVQIIHRPASRKHSRRARVSHR